MFSLIKGFFNLFFDKPTYKILIIGIDGGILKILKINEQAKKFFF